MLVKPLLFVSSYAPLFGLLAIRFERPNWLRWLCAVIAILGVGALWLLLHLDERKSRGAYRISAVKDGGGQAAGYLASYLLPFLTVSQPTTRDLVAYVGFLIVVSAVYMRSSLIQINPLLYILGWNVCEIEDSHGFRGYLITHRPVRLGDVVQATRFGEDVLVHRATSDYVETSGR